MYLKSIKAVGFKSFADKTNIEFNKKITAVVGPNGSGKSNIVDAIRWVLGEQSVKELRGSSLMSDVIFSGSNNRDALKKASVTLTFDNTDQYLNSDFDEVEIKREVYKTGENDYFINNVKVRLKDIQNLFLDTGAGLSAFNIISQGNITDIVNSKAIDRRIIFESAARVLKYKKRKEEALKKLDKTKDNLKSVRLVIDELKGTVLPLKKQSEDAKKFLNLKEEVQNIEIALLSLDISEYSEVFEKIEEDIASLNEKIEFWNKKNESSILEKYRFELIKLDEEISNNNLELIKINEEISRMSSEKQIMIERHKFSMNKDTINSSLVKSKEEEFNLKNKKEIIEKELETLKNDKSNLTEEIDKISNESIMLKIKRSTINSQVDDINKNILTLQNKIEITENNLINKDVYPKAIRSILNNPLFKNVHDTIGNLVNIEAFYSKAINISLGNAVNFIVVEDFIEAKKCINYLKDNNLGRATFFAIDTIKSRKVDEETLNILKDEKGFVGIASNLVSFDPVYKNIIENQLGNVLVVDDIDALNKIGKLINYKYRVVSLSGEILYSGGAVSGGSVQNASASAKEHIKKLKSELSSKEKTLKKVIVDFEDVSINYEKNEEKNQLLNRKLLLLNESINSKNDIFKEISYELDNKSFEIKGMDSVIEGTTEDELIKLIENLTEKAKVKSMLEKKLYELKDRKDNLHSEINTLEVNIKESNTEFNKINNELKNKEIEISKLSVKLENLLLTLGEDYNLTFEAAKENYFLEIPKDIARDKVKAIKREMNLLGDVNLGSISEYNRLNERYEFLLSQEEDLHDASSELHSIIDEMDNIMIDKFNKSFKEIREEFKKVFKEIFQGGKGDLFLTNPEDILTTGIEIVAEPPGKKLNSTMALSGGEKSLTAICLLFAILNVKPVPFIVLDEAEAALDETNVDMFGKYILNKKDQSQFIVITHKKKMMEYADVLYGIIMQERGVSKIVSAKLER